MKEKTGLQKRLRNYLSISLAFLSIFFAWFNGLRFLLPFEYYQFELAVFVVAGVLYLLVRGIQGAELPIDKILWWVLGLLLYFVLSVFISGNPHAGDPRLVSFLGAFVFGLIIWDAFRSLLNHKVVLSGLLIILGLVAFIAVFDVGLHYYSWWKEFGFEWVSPPFAYRIVGVMNSANTTMALVNIGAAITLALFIQEKQVQRRVLLGFWLFLYLMVIYFSSSRGGYLGAGAGIVFFILININWKKIQMWFRGQSVKRRVLLVTAAVLLLIVLAFGGYQFLIQTSSHPSHGGTTGELNTNRSGIWRLYFEIFRENPLFGSGIGRYLFEYFEITGNSPPNWIPFHAHSVPLGILAEFGVIGLILVAGLLMSYGRRVYITYQKLSPDERLIVSGVLAGMISLFAHAMVDDFIMDPTFMVLFILLAIWVVTFGGASGFRYSKRIRIWWLVPVLMVVAGLRYWDLAPYKYLSQAKLASDLGEMSYQEASKELDKAVEISPNSHHYLTQAGVFWFNAWVESQDPEDLRKSGDYLNGALEIEPGFSPTWMNKSLVSFYRGEVELALEEIGTAISLAPDEPIYYLNKGWFLEESDVEDLAVEAYEMSLHLSEKFNWGAHPFYQQTELRRRAWRQWGGEALNDKSFSSFMEAYNSGDMLEARKISAQLNWESDLELITARKMMTGLILLDEGDFDGAAAYIKDSYWLTYHPVRLLPLGWVTKWVYRTAGWEEAYLPGVLQLSAELGQMAAFDQVLSEIEGKIPEQTLCGIQIKYQLAIRGGELFQEAENLVPECNSMLVGELVH